MHFWRFGAATDVGLQRQNNEDCILSNPRLGLWVVADGMGGHAAGEVASAIVTQTVESEIRSGSGLSEAIQKSHLRVLEAAANGEGGHGMGSTVVALLPSLEHYQIAWVGDSRAYLWSPEADTRLTQITTDHSYVQMLYQTGAISENELESHPERNIITQCLGSTELDKVDVELIEGPWSSGDWVLLCSDGLSDVVAENSISDILASSKSAQQATESLIQAALEMGGRDNISVAVIEHPQKNHGILRAITRLFSKSSA